MPSIVRCFDRPLQFNGDTRDACADGTIVARLEPHEPRNGGLGGCGLPLLVYGEYLFRLPEDRPLRMDVP